MMKITNMRSKTFGVFFALLLGGYTSCNKDFTNLDPEFEFTADNFFNTEEQYFDALVGAYDLLASSWVYMMVGEFASDNSVAGGEFGCLDTPKWQELERFQHTVTNALAAEIWDDNFAGIARCNYFLDNEGKLDFAGKQTMIAEVRFLRAYFYFELTRHFGGVPVKNSSFVSGDEKSIPRASVEDTYSFIEADLEFAIANLPTTQALVGRVTKGAALGLMGKVQLYQNDFDQTITYLEQLTTMGYSLVPNYADQFTAQGENGPESVFEVQFSNAEAGNWAFDNSEEGNIVSWYSGPRYRDNTYAGGYSFNIPQADLANSYLPTDTRKAATLLNLPDYLGYADEAAIVAASEAGTLSYTAGCGTDSGFYYEKIIQKQTDYQGSASEYSRSSTNYRYIRYADVLLMLAEAYNRKSAPDDTKARMFLQQVVDRAHGTGTINITESGAVLRQRIWDERRWELAGEGHRYYDLIRTGQAATELTGFQTGKHELFPIPQDEIDFSQNNWGQNPGW